MIKANVEWHGEKSLIFEAGWDSIRRAALYYWQRLEDALNVPNPGVQKKRMRNTSAGAKGSSYTVYPHPSKPGEPPRKRTGFGAANVGYEFDQANLTANVGVGQAARYLAILELTRRRRLQRPWLLATLRKYWSQIAEMTKQ